MDLSALARPWIEIGRRLQAAGILAGIEGNLSQRFPEGARTADGEFVHPGAFLVTGGAVHKGSLAPEHFALLAPDGESLAGPDPSREWRMHLSIYQRRDDVHAVVHAHPPYATALALAGIHLPANLLPQLVADLGDLPFIPYATPGTDGAGETVETHIGPGNAALLEQHGALTLGATPDQAAWRMEALERAAQIYVMGRLLLGSAPRTLAAGQVAAILAEAAKSAH